MALGAPSCRPAQHDATTATSNQLGHCRQQAPFLTPGQVTESVPILDAPPPFYHSSVCCGEAQPISLLGGNARQAWVGNPQRALWLHFCKRGNMRPRAPIL